MQDKRFTTPVTLKRLEDEGQVEAAFSVFGLVDSDGDRLVGRAFKEGQSVPMVWSHDWTRPIGRGTVKVRPDMATVVGRFFTETAAGREAYLTVKAMGDLQNWSFGYRTKDSEVDRSGARVITDLELFEVSPVLVGANRSTVTLSVKNGATRPSADPALAAIRARLGHGQRVAAAEVAAIRAGLYEGDARERRQAAELYVQSLRVLGDAGDILGRRRGGGGS